MRISALALLKMAMHAKSGGSIEVMGMLQVRRRCSDDDERFSVQCLDLCYFTKAYLNSGARAEHPARQMAGL